MVGLRFEVARDLLLFENQLPFFVLAKLFNMSESKGSKNLGNVDTKETDDVSVEISPTQLHDLVLHFFSQALPFTWNADTSSYNSIEEEHRLCLTHEGPKRNLLLGKMVRQRLQLGLRFKNAEFEHLLGLIHATICISILDTEIDHAKEYQEDVVKSKKVEIFKHPFGLIRKAIIPLLPKTETFGLIGKAVILLLARMKNMRKTEVIAIERSNIHSATELEEAGVKFKKVEKYNSTFSIKFSNGQMEFSPLSIDDHTETYLRNLIAYEQYCDRKNGSYVVNYVRFMDDLINTPKDVALLHRKGIIRNCLGDDEIISNMVSRLCHYVSFSTNIYAGTSTNLNMHCKRCWNLWMAKLRRDYFNSPWALLSFLGAILLLALAIAQTIFSIIQ